MAKAKPHEWSQQNLAALIGMDSVNFGKFMNGMAYPNLHTMQKFEVVFEWPVVEQVQALPYMWEDRDLRYSMLLRKHTSEWAQANPRTVASGEVRMDPRLVSRHSRGPKRHDDD